MKKRKIIPLRDTKKAILGHPALNCQLPTTLSQILNFKRNNFRAMLVRNYAMNIANSIYVEYDEED